MNTKELELALINAFLASRPDAGQRDLYTQWLLDAVGVAQVLHASNMKEEANNFQFEIGFYEQ